MADVANERKINWGAIILGAAVVTAVAAACVFAIGSGGALAAGATAGATAVGSAVTTAGTAIGTTVGGWITAAVAAVKGLVIAHPLATIGTAAVLGGGAAYGVSNAVDNARLSYQR